MAVVNEIYRCSVCGNIVEIVHGAGGTLVCCNKPMNLQRENSVEASTEKHIPVIERSNGEVTIKVGSIEHPMVEEHYIEWIELVTEDKVYRKYLRPGEEPRATFKICDSVKSFTAREYCNIHGLWKAEA